MLGDDLTPFFIYLGHILTLSPRRLTTTAPQASLRRTMRNGCSRELGGDGAGAARCGAADRKAKEGRDMVDTILQVAHGDVGRRRHWQATPSPNRQSPNACTLALRRRMRCGPTVNLDCLKTFFERSWAPPAGLPSPVRGHTSADDEWLREKELVH